MVITETMYIQETKKSQQKAEYACMYVYTCIYVYTYYVNNEEKEVIILRVGGIQCSWEELEKRKGMGKCYDFISIKLY